MLLYVFMIFYCPFSANINRSNVAGKYDGNKAESFPKWKAFSAIVWEMSECSECSGDGHWCQRSIVVAGQWIHHLWAQAHCLWSSLSQWGSSKSNFQQFEGQKFRGNCGGSSGEHQSWHQSLSESPFWGLFANLLLQWTEAGETQVFVRFSFNFLQHFHWNFPEIFLLETIKLSRPKDFRLVRLWLPRRTQCSCQIPILGTCIHWTWHRWDSWTSQWWRLRSCQLNPH